MLNRHLAGATIAAVATGSGGGVGIIRISGPAAEAIGRRLCRPWPASIVSHHLYLGQVFEPAQALAESPAVPHPAAATQGGEVARAAARSEVIDQVLFCLMRAPHSYTGEDVLEIHGHGGAVNLQRLLEACYAAGATAAQPGEFTRRAFLAGKLDLTRAEAIAALVGAQSVHAARQAQRQLAGELGKRVVELRREAITLLGEFEGILDFPDAEADTAIFSQASRKLTALQAHIDALQASFHHGGRALHSGLEIAILGRPNVGKSSLINALCGSERVLVDDQPGTTRDFVEVSLQWGGVPVTLIDTAGERTADANRLELQGMRLGRERWRNADLCLLVVDGTAGLGPQEEQLLSSIPAEIPRLLIWNKTDQTACLPPPAGAITCSALCGWGLAEVRQAALHEVAPRLAQSDSELLVTSARQAQLLQSAATALRNASQALLQNAPPELVAGELRVATARLGELTGHEVTPQVLDEIFARFCVGK